MKLPAYFISHGSPDLLIRKAPASEFLRQMDLPDQDVRAILMVSAHWEAERALITASDAPDTIHDFYGFPEPLYDIAYPAPGNPALAQQIVEVLKEAGIDAGLDTERGLDHGAWMPLHLARPDAETPVLQLSLVRGRGAQFHYRLGQALSSLRDAGVLIIGSGNVTHNIRAAFRRQAQNAQMAQDFDQWLDNTLADRNDDQLLDWLSAGPHARWNHPSDDHIMPLFVVIGATKAEPSARLHHSFDMEVLSMASYQFGETIYP